MAFNIDIGLVSRLIAQQFSSWAQLSIMPVAKSGWDNRTFRLGNDLLVRLPSAPMYAAQVLKEQHWLPALARDLSLPIPTPVALGKPSSQFPWHWSIYRWIPGNTMSLSTINDCSYLANDLANFINELRRIETTGAPKPGMHNFFRGAHPAVYNHDVRLALAQLSHMVDVVAVRRVWQKALLSRCQHQPVWVHGDMSINNLLCNHGRLAAVIDFGMLAAGDPACDLVIAWTMLSPANRVVFKNAVNQDAATWDRARGWAVWKALITLVKLPELSSAVANENVAVINQILADNDS